MKGNVNLLLLHPLPDYILYDIMAIYHLEPIKIFLYYMKDGGAGSWFLHRFLRKNGVNTLGKMKTDKIIEEELQISPHTCIVKHKYTQVF